MEIEITNQQSHIYAVKKSDPESNDFDYDEYAELSTD